MDADGVQSKHSWKWSSVRKGHHCSGGCGISIPPGSRALIENIKRRINLIDRAADRRAQLERTHMDPDHDPALEAIEEAAALNNRWSTLYWCAVCGQKREEFLNTHVPK